MAGRAGWQGRPAKQALRAKKADLKVRLYDRRAGPKGPALRYAQPEVVPQLLHL